MMSIVTCPLCATRKVKGYCRTCSNPHADHRESECPYSVHAAIASATRVRACRALACTTCLPGQTHYCAFCKDNDANHTERSCPLRSSPKPKQRIAYIGLAPPEEFVRGSSSPHVVHVGSPHVVHVGSSPHVVHGGSHYPHGGSYPHVVHVGSHYPHGGSHGIHVGSHSSHGIHVGSHSSHDVHHSHGVHIGSHSSHDMHGGSHSSHVVHHSSHGMTGTPRSILKKVHFR